MNTLLTESCKEAKDGNMTLQQSVSHMANNFLNAVELSVMEACYDILVTINSFINEKGIWHDI